MTQQRSERAAMDFPTTVVITDTDSAREYLVQWMLEHFPSDQTFSAHIREELTGDFAWQLAKALSTMQSPEISAVARTMAAKLAHLFSPEKRRVNIPTTGWSFSGHGPTPPRTTSGTIAS